MTLPYYIAQLMRGKRATWAKSKQASDMIEKFKEGLDERPLQEGVPVVLLGDDGKEVDTRDEPKAYPGPSSVPPKGRESGVTLPDTGPCESLFAISGKLVYAHVRLAPAGPDGTPGALLLHEADLDGSGYVYGHKRYWEVSLNRRPSPAEYQSLQDSCAQVMRQRDYYERRYRALQKTRAEEDNKPLAKRKPRVKLKSKKRKAA